MDITDIARAFEASVNKRGIARRRAQGWLPKILPYTGYGSQTKLHVLARAVMAPADDNDPLVSRPVSHFLELHSPTIDALDDFVASAQLAANDAQRGWRQFFTTQVGNLRVKVKIGGKSFTTRTDTNGYINLLVSDHGLEPGYHEAEIIPAQGQSVRAPVLIVSSDARFGIISDIDDTVLVTWLPRMLTAAWNSFVLHTDARQSVPGMAEFLRGVLEDHPDAPVFYVSTGAWNTLPAIQGFLHRENLPLGPLLMTDWGPTPTGLFRNGQEHKRIQLRNLLITFPQIKWLLVGDDGQHDPMIYDDLAREHPSRVAAIALRELDVIEHVLSNGMGNSIEALHPSLPMRPASIPLLRGHDGFALLREWEAWRKTTCTN